MSCEQRLHEQVPGRARVQVVEDVLEREAVLRPEREDDRLLVGGRLQLEAEAAAEALAQRQTPCAIDAAAKWRVKHELHAARLVEEALEHHARRRGNGAQGALTLFQVGGELLCRARREPDLLREPAFVAAALAHARDRVR